ncbi:DUF6985 domain-containing protein [Planctomycetes bacterium TBK1r]|uniref:DUF6985 domain-containing protein n=1 Tax=Stieleria magnilauensis TaxID=2527963 RepID=A0ABX5XZQ0_9BACT|nr:hypothetical protein TBK1r_65540 [Planctomycetes bacterium TBK1r]
MTAFFDNFKSDDWDDRIVWKTEAPLFVDAQLIYEFNSLRGVITKNPRSRRTNRVDVYAHNQLENGYQRYQEVAWKYLTTRVDSIERAVTKKLWLDCHDNFNRCLDSISDTDRTWKSIRSRENWNDTSVLRKQIALADISLFDTELNGHGLFTLDFAVGWDEEHGVSVLMCRNKVIATSSCADFTCRGDSLLDHAKCIQNCNYTEGDLRL